MAAGSPRATASGGIADKWGNRYEARWTIWRGVLPVLRGEFDAIQVEPPDLLGEGGEFRLFGKQPGGFDEVHQCKRRNDSSWTARALDREGLLAPFGRHLAAGTSVVFASGTDSVLRTVASKARQNELEDWLAELNQKEDEAKEYLVGCWTVDESEVRRRLTILDVRLIDDETLLTSTIENIDRLILGDAEIALLYLADFVINNVRMRLTGRRLWDFLRTKGFSLREGQEPAMSERVLALKDRYVEGIEHLRPSGLAVLARPEVNQIVEGLSSPDGPRVVVVTGPPGSGKSTVLAGVCVRLTEMGVVVGPLRLDAAQEAWTAEALGCQQGIGFGGPPARITSRAAGGDPAVLVVDQLDSLSILSGRGDLLLEGVRDMLTQARASDRLRVLIACRKYDFDNDPRLRLLVHGETELTPDAASRDLLQVAIGDLEEEQVRGALAALGVEPETLSSRFRELVASPFNLGLVASIVQNARSSPGDFDLIHSRHDLLAAYDTRLRQRTYRVLGRNGFTFAVHRIAADLSQSGMLSFARDAFADIPDDIDVLVYEGVLIEHAGRLRFFHDEYFNFVFARQHLQAGRAGADLIRDDTQDIFRRNQVTAILGEQRRRRAPSYEADLRTILDASLTRSHLRAAVLAWLTDQSHVEDDELRLVAELAGAQDDPLRQQALWVLCSTPFGHALQRHGLLTVAACVLRGARAPVSGQLAELIQRLGMNDCGMLLFEIARHLPEEVSTELIPLAADPKIAPLSVVVLLRSVFLSGPAAGTATAELFCVLTETVADLAETQAVKQASSGVKPAHNASANVLAAISALYAEHGPGILALNTLAQRSAAPATLGIHAYLTAAARISKANGGLHAFDRKGPLPDRRTGLDTYANTAEREPKEFASAMTPFLIEQLQLAADPTARHYPAGNQNGQSAGLRYDHIFGYGSLGHDLYDELYYALQTALCWCAAEDPDTAFPLLGQLTDTDLLIAHQLAASALSTCASPMLPAALSWASRPAVRGLSRGITSSWAWGEVLAHLAATGNVDQQAAALDLATQPYCFIDMDAAGASEDRLKTLSGDEVRRIRAERDLAVEQIVALSLIERRLGTATPAAVKGRLAELEQILGPVPSKPDPQPFVARQSPPLNAEVLAFSDSEWATALRTSIPSPGQPPDLTAPGVPSDITDELEVAAKQHPARFAQIVTSIGPAAQPEHIRVVLRAIASVGQEIPRNALAPVVQLAQDVSSWPMPQLNQSLCGLISALANHSIPDDITGIAATIATTASDPPASVAPTKDLVSAGWTTDRGQALKTLAELLAPAETRQHRAHLMADALIVAVDDPAEHVRVMLPPILDQICSVDAMIADELTQRWLSKASDNGLRAPRLDSLAWQLLTLAKSTGADLVRRMLGPAEPEVRTRGGMLAALASLRQIKLPGDNAEAGVSDLLHHALNDPAARKGVAILMAQRVDELPEQLVCDTTAAETPLAVDRGLLVRLLDDSDEQVRNSVAQYPLHLTTPCYHADRLLSATAMSRAFGEHPAATLHLLRRPGETLPVNATLDLCERWLAGHAQEVGDIRTAAAGDGYYVVDIALAAHARTATGSDQRKRTLTLLDRLIESGAIEANAKVDTMGDIYI